MVVCHMGATVAGCNVSRFIVHVKEIASQVAMGCAHVLGGA